MATKKETERDEAREQLRGMIAPGDTVYTSITHVSRSGMSRDVAVYVVVDGEIVPVHWTVARAIGYSMNQRRDAVRVGGCGFDAGFDVVYSIGRALYGEGFGCIGAGCPSNDHSNGDRDYTPHPGCGTPDKRGHRDHWHTSGGYALTHRSL